MPNLYFSPDSSPNHFWSDLNNWFTGSRIAITPVAPADPILGDIWQHPVTKETNIWNGSGWELGGIANAIPWTSDNMYKDYDLLPATDILNSYTSGVAQVVENIGSPSNSFTISGKCYVSVNLGGDVYGGSFDAAVIETWGAGGVIHTGSFSANARMYLWGAIIRGGTFVGPTSQDGIILDGSGMDISGGEFYGSLITLSSPSGNISGGIFSFESSIVTTACNIVISDGEFNIGWMDLGGCIINGGIFNATTGIRLLGEISGGEFKTSAGDINMHNTTVSGGTFNSSANFNYDNANIDNAIISAVDSMTISMAGIMNCNISGGTLMLETGGNDVGHGNIINVNELKVSFLGNSTIISGGIFNVANSISFHDKSQISGGIFRCQGITLYSGSIIEDCAMISSSITIHESSVRGGVFESEYIWLTPATDFQYVTGGIFSCRQFTSGGNPFFAYWLDQGSSITYDWVDGYNTSYESIIGGSIVMNGTSDNPRRKRVQHGGTKFTGFQSIKTNSAACPRHDILGTGLL